MLYEEIIRWDIRKIKKNFALLNDSYSREVYILDENNIIKIPKRTVPAAIKQSVHEKELYSNRSNYEDEFLCPLLCEYKGRIIMTRAQHIKEIIQETSQAFYCGSIEEDFETLTKVCQLKFENFGGLQMLKEAVSHLNINRKMGLGDLRNTRNWGVLNNKLVLFDYGLSEEIYEKHYKKR